MRTLAYASVSTERTRVDVMKKESGDVHNFPAAHWHLNMTEAIVD